MSKLAVHGAFLVSSKVFSGLATIAGGVFLARWLTVEEYGSYSQFILIARTIVLFSNLAIPRSMLYFVPRAQGKDEKDGIVVQLFLLTVVFSLAFSALFIPSAPFWADWMQNSKIVDAALYIAVYLFFLSVNDIFEPMLVTLGRAKLAALVQSLTGLGLFIAVLVPLLTNLDYSTILLFMSLVFLLKLALAFPFLRTSIKGLSLSQLFSETWEKVKYSAPLAVSSMIAVINRRADQLLVSALFSPTQFALYSRGAFELPLVGVLPMTLATLMVPGFTENFNNGRPDTVARQFADKARSVALLFFPLAVLMIVLAEVFIVLLFSEKYVESVPVFRIYLLLLPLRIAVYDAVLRAAGLTGKFIKANLICTTSNVVISLILLRLIGITGAAWGTIISMALYSGLLLNLNSRVLNVELSQILPWKELGKIMVAALVAGLASSFLLRLPVGSLFQLVIVSAAFTIVYIGAGSLLKVFSGNDLQFLKDLLGKKPVL